MRAKILVCQLGNCRHRMDYGGIREDLVASAEEKLNEELKDLERNYYSVVDVKVNCFTSERHNNGGCDDTWVKYTIFYK